MVQADHKLIVVCFLVIQIQCSVIFLPGKKKKNQATPLQNNFDSFNSLKLKVSFLFYLVHAYWFLLIITSVSLIPRN